MKQKRIQTIGIALSQATQAIGGATEHAAGIGALTNTAPAITADRDDLIAKRDGHETAKVQVKTKRTTLRALDATAFTFATLARDMLKAHLGRQYSTAWNVAGFAGSLTVPRTPAGLKVLLEQLSAYFTANPAHQNTEANITAVRAKAIFDQLVAAENDWNSAKTAVRQALAAKTGAFKKLVTRLSGTFRELNQLLPSTSVVYLSYGFNIPGIQSTPAVPTNLLAVLVGPAAAALKWDAAERAERYRVWKKVIGVDADFVLVETRDDLDFVVEGLPSGKSVTFAISAVNAGGESEKSEVVTIQTA